MSSKSILLFGVYIFSSVLNVFAGGCPEVKIITEELFKEGGSIYLQVNVEPNKFRLFERVEVFQIEKTKKPQLIKKFSAGLWPRELAQGKNSIILFDENDISRLTPDTIYQVVFDVDGFEGCIKYYEVFFILIIKDNDVLIFQAHKLNGLEDFYSKAHNVE